MICKRWLITTIIYYIIKDEIFPNSNLSLSIYHWKCKKNQRNYIIKFILILCNKINKIKII